MSASFSEDVEWYAASNRIATFAEFPNSADPTVFFVYEPRTLALVSSGLLPTDDPLDEIETTFSAAGGEGRGAAVEDPQSGGAQEFRTDDGRRHTSTGEGSQTREDRVEGAGLGSGDDGEIGGRERFYYELCW